MDLSKIAKKWQKKWEDAKVFQVEADNRPKYYIAFVYPYMSGLLHLGHLFTYTSPEILLRYKRMNNFNVLAKFGFHCTGTPIVAAAQKVREKEPMQLKSLKKMGIEEKDIPKFIDPEYWCEYFPKETLKDLKNMGFAIDERYTFRTTYLDPPYNAFITWQFNKLKEKGYVKKGRHPVIWCPKDNLPVGDHDRSEGEGETLKDFIWVKFRLKDSNLILMAGTTRPDALYGQTNLWLHPDRTYSILQMGKEKWVVASQAIEKIESQFNKGKVIGTIKASELIGKWVKGPLVEREVYVLPADFVDLKVGSGIVYSALETPQDLMEVKRLNDNPGLLKKHNLDPKIVKKIVPINNIKVEGMGHNLGQEICNEFGAKSYKDKEKLESAKQEINKRVFRKGIMRDICGKYSGLTVQKAQVQLKKDLAGSNDVVMFYEISGKVVCRCLTECIVKLVSDQWFIEYNDESWKKAAHKCLSKMKIYPEKVRKQFEYVLDWLNHWACTREFGLGTKLPWDNKWVIESLSDSTIQMAYSTISKYLEHPQDYGFKTDKLNDEFFDYVFLGKGDLKEVEKTASIPQKMISKMKNDFEYWYPFDFRNSAKDLLQNHLAFCIFNHTALFPEKYWPKAFILNGRIMVNNEKMSKSKGNFFTMRELYAKHGPDTVRLTAAIAGEGIDDANYGMSFLEVAEKKLTEIHTFIKENYNKGRSTTLNIDKWFESIIHDTIRKTTNAFENMLFKSAVQYSFLDLQRNLKWYLKRTNNSPNKSIISLYVETQLKLLAPFTPHFSEECWEIIGKKGFISNAQWPKANLSLIKPSMSKGEELIINTLHDIREVKKLAKINNPEKIKLFTGAEWKYSLFKKAGSYAEKNQNPREILKKIMQDEKFKRHGKEISRFLPNMIAKRKIPIVDLSQKEELSALKEAIDFIKNESGCKIEVIESEKSQDQKAKQAMPGKVAIMIE